MWQAKSLISKAIDKFTVQIDFNHLSMPIHIKADEKRQNVRYHDKKNHL
jgi:hypothetical protein